MYPLLATGEELASPPLEQIARAQVELGEPSIVRFQLTPTAAFFEDSRAALFRRHEQRLVRREHSTPRPAGLSSTLDRSEMQNAGRTQNRSLFWLETVIAADSTPACKTVAAAVQSRRGENRLHRRIMIVRQRVYRRRFPLALGPLIPSMRSLVSAAEVAHLLELPTARMKGVPVRRTALPRIPAPPNIRRAARARQKTRRASRVGEHPVEKPIRPGGPLPGPAGRERAGRDRARRPQVRRAADRRPGIGKSAALLALYLNDCEDPDAAPLVIDPKSELSQLCLKFTRPECGKTVWYLPRLYNEDYAILSLLDRAGLAPRSLIGRAALPDRAPRTVAHRLTKLYRHGLIAQHPTGLAGHTQNDGTPPLLYSLTRRGLEVAQTREPPAISRKREWRAIEQSQRRAPRTRPARARVGDRAPPDRRQARHRPLAHCPIRNRPLPRPANRQRPRPPRHHPQRNPARRQAGDHRPAAEELHRAAPRPLARARSPDAKSHLRPARRTRPHQPPLLQPRQAPRLRRLPLRLEPRPPPLPRAGHPTRRHLRLPRTSRRARARARSRPSPNRPHRHHGHPRRALVLPGSGPYVHRRRSRHPPPLPRRARPPAPTPRAPRAAHRPTRSGANPSPAPPRQAA